MRYLIGLLIIALLCSCDPYYDLSQCYCKNSGQGVYQVRHKYVSEAEGERYCKVLEDSLAASLPQDSFSCEYQIAKGK